MAFDYLIANPPYGKDWKRDEAAVRAAHERGAAGRFGPGLPRISDGQLLFLLHMLAHARDLGDGGSRIAIIMNGSPLFTGDAGSGESEIRRFILENDLLEALIALPEQLFYNTGIATYVWVVTNRKAPARKGLVQLIDATSFWVPMRRSLGDKRREIPLERAQEILGILRRFTDGETRRVDKDGSSEEITVSRVFPTTHFGFRKVTIERPLRLNFQATPERIARLEQQTAFQNLAVSRRTGAAGERQQAEGRALQAAILELLASFPRTLFKERDEFERLLADDAERAGIRLRAPVRKAILAALAERDETAAPCLDDDGRPEPDPELRDTESVTTRARRGPGGRGRSAVERARVLRPRSAALRARRLDRHHKARRERWQRRRCRLRDQLQPLLLPLHAASPARGDRGRHPRHRGRHRPDARGGHERRRGRFMKLRPARRLERRAATSLPEGARP